MPGLFHAPFGQGQFAEAVPLWFQANFAKQRQKPDEDRIFSAFGRFIAAYALAEGGIHIAARFFSGMREDKARVVFVGMRLSDVMGRLRNLVSDTQDADNIEEIIAQVKIIGAARNQFVHRLIEYDHGKGLTVTNRLICKSAYNAEPKTFGLYDLEAMELDCRVIFGRLAFTCHHPDSSGVSLIELYGPWRYKPHVPDNPKKRTPEAQKESKRQRRASRLSPSDQHSK